MQDWEKARAEGKMVLFGPGTLSPAEQEERRLAHLRDVDSVRQGFRQLKAEHQQRLAPFDAFDLLAALQIAFTQDWPKGKAPVLQGVLATAELLALLLVERGQRAPLIETEAGEAEFISAVEQFGGFVDSVLKVTPAALAPLPIPADESAEGALQQLRHQMIFHHLLSPLNETYAQLETSTVDLFGHPLVRQHLEHELKVDAGAALQLADAVGNLTVDGYTAAVAGPDNPRLWRGHGSRFSFSVEDLAAAAGVEAEQARRFAERFSLTFDGSELGFAELTTRARLRPLLRDGEILMPISIPLLRRSLRSSLAALLNPDLPAAGTGDKGAFAAFTARRGAWLENKAMATFEEALRPDWTQLNVYFRLPDGRRGEIDGLLRIDDTLLIVQAKSGVTRIDTEAADKTRFRETLIGMLGGANLRQHREAREAIACEDALLTLDPAGEVPFRRDLNGIHRVIPVHVTLDDLSAVGAQAWHLVTAGISEDHDLPWIIGIGHLELLLQYFESPALFVHFLTRRLRANSNGQLLAYDEVDWAVRYGEDQLRWAELPTEDPFAKRKFMVLEEHDEFDRWVLAREAGERGKKPRLRLSAPLRRLLASLDSSRPPDWLGFSLTLLDLSDAGRKEVMKLWQHQRSHRRGPSTLPFLSFRRDGKAEVGFAVLHEEDLSGPFGEQVLRTVCLRRMAETGAPRWAGIVVPADPGGPLRWCCSLGEDPVRT